MSEKKVKKTLEYPVYNMEELMTILCDICKSAGDFPPQHLVNLIIQDWLISFLTGQSRGMSASDVVLNFVKHTTKNSDKFSKLKESLNASQK